MIFRSDQEYERNEIAVVAYEASSSTNIYTQVCIFCFLMLEDNLGEWESFLLNCEMVYIR